MEDQNHEKRDQGEGTSNFKLTHGFASGETPKEETVATFSRRLDAIFGDLESKLSDTPIADTLAKKDIILEESSDASRKFRRSNPKICRSCGSQSHLSPVCPHVHQNISSAARPTSQKIPSHLRDQNKYKHYRIDEDYDPAEERKSALDFITQLRKKDQPSQEDVSNSLAGFTPVFASKKKREKTKKSCEFSTIKNKTQELLQQELKEVKDSQEHANNVALSHLGDEDVSEETKSEKDVTTQIDTEQKQQKAEANTSFKRKKRGGKRTFRKVAQDASSSQGLEPKMESGDGDAYTE